MGYSARYHAASLAAVFFALAIGILLGSQYGGELLNSTRKDLEKSLTKDLDASRTEVSELERREGWSNSFGRTVYPLLVDSRLAGRRIGLVGFGELPSEVTESVEEAIEPTGGRLVAVGALRQPPETGELADALGGTRLAGLGARPRLVTRFGETFGRQLVTGGRVLELTDGVMFSQSSGQFGRLDGLVFYRDEKEAGSGDGAGLSDQLDRAVVSGAAGTGIRVVGVETLGTEPSGIGFFHDNNLTTVDNVDMPSGKVSLIYSLNGAVGSFGVGPDAGALVPELLAPVPGSSTGPDRAEGKG
ncbi:MAG: copper transporter [Solirubrobacterales bacterium]|nr:copper transporter [Solirubrobacterales bacterium]